MSFSPDLSVSVLDKCGTLKLVDSTGEGSDGWWDGETGITASNVTGATITITNTPTGASYTSPLDVTSAVTGATTICGSFTLTAAAGTYPDGLYELTYSINVDGEQYNTDVDFWGFCNAEYGIDQMFAKYANMIETQATDKYLHNANKAAALLRSLKSAISASDVDALSNIQSRIDRILNFHDVPNLY